jgi:hypothetical protein
MRIPRFILWSVACSALLYFSTLSHTLHELLKKLKSIKYVFVIFSTTFVWNVSHPRKKWTRYDHMYTDLHVKCSLYRMIKKSLCIWWLQSRKLQVMFTVPRQSPDIYWHADLYIQRPTLRPSVILNSNYVITESDWNCLKYFCVFLCCNHHVHREFFYHPVLVRF